MTNLAKSAGIDVEKFEILLQSGKLYEFEELLYAEVQSKIYDVLAAEIIANVAKSEDFQQKMKGLASHQQLRKLRKRKVRLQLRTGTYIWAELDYAKVAKKKHEASRYLAFQYWAIVDHATPSYYSLVSKFSVLCASFEVVKNVFTGLQIACNLKRIRSLSLAFSKKCLLKRIECMLSDLDDLKDKRVVISSDGGRIRTRQYKEDKNQKATHHKFETPWKEPKLLVITIIDKDGKSIKKELPIYDATFTESALFELLTQYLKVLNISKASEVQVIADGALWIWNNAKNTLLKLGVSEDKIVETLDFYHAAEHLKELVDLLPKEKNKSTSELYTELKTLIWEGKVEVMIDKIKAKVKRTSDKIRTELAYFTKNITRMNYQKYREDKWLCGSGIIESGVRRMINLRFKSPSSFWKQENLDGLIYLRCALLSGRWENIMNTVTKY